MITVYVFDNLCQAYIEDLNANTVAKKISSNKISCIVYFIACQTKETSMWANRDDFSNDLSFTMTLMSTSIETTTTEGVSMEYKQRRSSRCLTANQLPNRLFLNQGNFSFKDITETAGVAEKPGQLE